MKRLWDSNSGKLNVVLAGLLAGAGSLAMVLFPSIALRSAQNGVRLWAGSVLPALLPFFICANFMIALSVPKLIGKFFERPFQALFGTPGCSAFVFLISITSGYPMGAKLIGDMKRRGEIDGRDSRRMLAFCSTSGPLFMLGTVGVSMLASPAAGAIIAISHYLGAVVNGMAARLFVRKKIWKFETMEREPRRPAASDCPLPPLLELFTDSILSSFRTLGVICGYIVLFSILTDLLQFSGLLHFLSADFEKGAAKGILEMTVGCGGVTGSISLSLAWKCVLCTFLISFGGLSIAAQSASMLSGTGIGIGYYLGVKLSHGLFSAVIASFLCRFFLPLSSVTTGFFPVDNQAAYGMGALYGLLFSTKMIFLILGIFIALCLSQAGYIHRKSTREAKKRRRQKQRIEKGRRKKLAAAKKHREQEKKHRELAAAKKRAQEKKRRE